MAGTKNHNDIRRVSKYNHSRKQFKEFLRAYTRNPQAMVGLCILVFIVCIAVFAPVIATHDPDALVGTPFTTPCKEYLFGTDSIGRDYFSRVIYGTRVSLIIGITAASISGLVGTMIGAAAGFFGKKVDAILSEVIDVMLMIPTFFLIMIIATLYGGSVMMTMIVIGLTSWTGNARVMRSQALSLRSRTFVTSARAMGEKELKIMFKYIIPNGIFPVISNTTMQIATAILTESGLSFLGLGDPNAITWGQMIYGGRAYMASAWWLCVIPGIGILLTVTAFYLIGDGLNKVLNPKLRD